MADAATMSFAELDNATVSRHHLKIMFISGMGFFTDAYDLFIIGVVMSLLKPLWHVGKVETSLVDSTALLASAFGALLFGRVADMLGRKRIYGVELLVLAAGAIACAFSPNIWWLIGFRFILGFGIGGDYPVFGHDYERVLGQGFARAAGDAGIHDAGRRTDPRTPVCIGPSVDGSFARRHLANPPRLRCGSCIGCVLAAAASARDSAISRGCGASRR